MRAHRHKPSEIEGLLLVEFVDEHGSYSTGLRTEAQVASLKTRKTCAVAGRVRGGLLYREGSAAGEPLRPFGIYVEGRD